MRQITVARLDNQLTTDADAMDDENGTNEGDVRGADEDWAGGTEGVRGGGGDDVPHLERDDGRGATLCKTTTDMASTLGGRRVDPRQQRGGRRRLCEE